MNKSTHFKHRDDESAVTKELKPEKLPRTPKKSTINNILAFSRSYSIRRSKIAGLLEFMLN